MFTKAEIIQRWDELRAAAVAEGKPLPRANLALAVEIANTALFQKSQWSGKDYIEHPIRVAFNHSRSNTKQIVGMLHDVVEDSDWTLDDLRAVGFSDEIVDAVDAMTIRPGEKYFDFMERCSLNALALDKKIDDLEHNMSGGRNTAQLSPRQIEKQKIYIVAINYAQSVRRGETEAGSPIQDFVKRFPALDPGAYTMEEYSSRRPAGTGTLKPGDYSPW